MSILKRLKCAFMGHHWTPHYTIWINETSKSKITGEISQCKCCRVQYHALRSIEK